MRNDDLGERLAPTTTAAGCIITAESEQLFYFFYF